MATRLKQPELAVGDKVPEDFTHLRGASSMAYAAGVGLKYRRHFWYVTKYESAMHSESVEHVCTSYRDARDTYCAMVEEQIKKGYDNDS